MARRKRGLAPEDDEPKVDISSLIDVCFLLLIYFIVTSTITEPESDLVLKLPSNQSNSDEKPDIDPILFKIDSNGGISQIEAGDNEIPLVSAGHPEALHRTPEELPQLDEAVRNYAGIAKERAMVQVSAPKDAKAQHVVDLLNVLAKYKIKQITFTKLPSN